MREEPFMVLPVEVKTKQNLYEGLDLFIKGDMLEGDNAFYCDRCDKKVDTLKRSTFKKLPNVLFIALKWFDFDFESMRWNKLNTYFEFPDKLNMKDYC